MSYTEEVLDMLNKKELITMVLSLQSKELKKKKLKKNWKKKDLILLEIRKVNHKFTQLELENAVTKQEKSFLSTLLIDM